MSRDRLIAGPAIIYIGAEDTPRPFVYTDDPTTAITTPNGTLVSGSWAELALKQYGDELRVRFPQTLNAERLHGETYPTTHFRSEEDGIISLQVKNMDLNALNYAFNTNTVTPTAVSGSDPAYDTMRLERGIRVKTHSLLMRFVSPWGPGKNLQIWFPQVIVNGEIDLPMMKSEATMYTLEWTAEKHETSGVGVIEVEK